MQEVFGSAFPRTVDAAETPSWPIPSHGGWRLRCVVPPVLATAMLVALMLHLVTELARRLSLGDPVADMSVIMGISAVLVTLFPFAALCLHRMRVALRPGSVQDGGAHRR